MLRFFDRLNLSPAERRLVVIILVIAVVVLNYWLIWPRFGDFQTVTNEYKALARKKAAFEAEIARRPMYELNLRKLQEAGSVLPAGEERIQFRTDMERTAREVGLSVRTWGEVLPERATGTTAATNAFFEAISLSMSQVLGTEAQFVDFLYRVGASNSTIRVKELNLVPGNFDARAQGKTNLVGTLKLVASIPKAPPKGAPAAAGGPVTTAPVSNAASRAAGAIAAARGQSNATISSTAPRAASPTNSTSPPKPAVRPAP